MGCNIDMEKTSNEEYLFGGRLKENGVTLNEENLFGGHLTTILKYELAIAQLRDTFWKLSAIKRHIFHECFIQYEM